MTTIDFVRNNLHDLTNAPVLNMLNIKKNFDRASPTAWFFFFAVIGLIVGLSIASLKVVAVISAVIILVYILTFLFWWLWGV